MAEGQSLPAFRPLPQKTPDVSMTRKGGTFYISANQPPGDRPKTIPHCLDERAAQHPDRAFLRERDPATDEWVTLTYGEAKTNHRQPRPGLPRSRRRPRRARDAALGQLDPRRHGHTRGAEDRRARRPDLRALLHDVHRLRQAEALLQHGKAGGRFCRTTRTFQKAIAALPTGAFKIVSAAPEGDNAVISYDALCATAPTPAVAAAMAKLDDSSIGKYLFTSGSTGMPKPVPTTQGAMCSMIGGQEGLKDTARDPEHDPDRVDHFLDWLPWNHISGSNVNFNGALWNGSTFWIDGGKPTPALFHETIRNIREASPSVFGTAPIALSMLAEAMEQDETLLKAFFKNMRSIGYGGATLSDDLYDRLQALSIKATGRRIPIVTMYGATETQGITVVHWEVERVGLIGLPLPGTTLKLVPNGEKAGSPRERPDRDAGLSQ
jgi:feruloyl-CoA synthase